MRADRIKEVRVEIERFLSRLKELELAKQNNPGWGTPAESGAVRRASMDLTRALAKLRRHD